MKSVQEIFAQLEEQRLKLGLSQAEVGKRAFGQADGSALQNMKRGSAPSVERLMAMAEVLGLNVSIGPPPETVVRQVTIAGSDFASIPLHEAYLSAGPGAENGNNVAIIDHLVFLQEWLRKIDVKPADAALARVSGDNMAPAIQNGDLVMIDKTRREVPLRRPTRKPHQLPIFAFIQDQEARVKRLERFPQEKLLILYSDNKDIAPEFIGESNVNTIKILGQVVWSGHVWR